MPSLIVDTIKVGSNTVEGFVEFTTIVVPEFPLLIAGAITSIGILAL